jgi:DNA (cytosine-5)-methyltransferase 1
VGKWPADRLSDMGKHNRKLRVYRRTAPAGRGRTCIDLFCGAGGLAVGFRQAGWSILAANDIDAHAGATFRLNFPEASFFEGPISALSSELLLNECQLLRGELDCLIGGPPCQSFSYNNHQRSAEDERARLFTDYLRLVAQLRPKTFVMENVPGILTIGSNTVIKEIAAKLSRLNYDSAVEVLSAEEFGVPQIRRRVFIVASRIGSAADLLPIPTHRSGALRQPTHKLNAGKTKHGLGKRKPVTVQEAIGDLPRLRSGGGSHLAPRPKGQARSPFQQISRRGRKALYNHVCRTLTKAMLDRIRHVPEGGNWRDIPRRLLPAGMRRARLTDHTKRYGRLSRKGIASTILTKCDPHWGAYIHPTQNRTISVREVARLQGFPDQFVFAGEHLSKQYAQLGNAVPVPIARAIGEVALEHVIRWVRKKSRLRAKKSSAARIGRHRLGAARRKPSSTIFGEKLRRVG